MHFEQLPGNFSNSFLDIKKFCQVLSTCQISDQLHHSNRNYRGGGGAESVLPMPYQSAKSPACLGLKGHSLYGNEATILYLTSKYYSLSAQSEKLDFLYINQLHQKLWSF